MDACTQKYQFDEREVNWLVQKFGLQQTSKVWRDSRRQDEALPGYIGRCIIYKAITSFQVAGYNFMQLAGWKRKS